MTLTLRLTPRSPLVFGGGTRFGVMTAESVLSGLPLPGTLAGALRAAVADTLDLPLDSDADHAALVERITIGGPLLAQGQGLAARVFFPRPADAVYLQTNDCNAPQLVRARPCAPGAHAGCDLPAGLMPVQLEDSRDAKRAAAPAFWSARGMTAWLLNGAGPGANSTTPLPPRDLRSHVAIDPATQAHLDGRLYQTAGLDFGPRRRAATVGGYESAPWSLLARAGDAGGAPLDALHGKVRRLGADGRSVRLTADAAWPALDAQLAEALSQLVPGDHFRLVLATPAVFSAGWRPGWADSGLIPGTATKVALVAAAVDGWIAASGWSLRSGQPRAIRRLAPAGSVYWFKLLEGSGRDLLPLWLAPISDRAEDRQDGYGLALPGLASIERTSP